jgi:hypothetical protein
MNNTMKRTYENVLVTCTHGECCPDGQVTIHRLICPNCENVIWVVGDDIIAEKPTEEWSTPDLKWEGTLTMRSHKCTCPDCNFTFESGDKCWVCGKGTSFYHLGDTIFTEEQFKEMMEKKLNKCLVSKKEYINNFDEARRKNQKKNELSIELNKVQNEARNRLDELKILEAERDSIIEAANRYNGDRLPTEFKTKMEESIAKFKEWESIMQTLRTRAENIKKEMNSIL